MKGIIRAQCARAGIADVDEIRQLVIFTVSTEAIEIGKIPEARAIFGVVKKTAHHKIGDAIRKSIASPTVLALDLQGPDTGEGRHEDAYLRAPAETDVELAAISRFDHERSVERFLERLRGRKGPRAEVILELREISDTVQGVQSPAATAPDAQRHAARPDRRKKGDLTQATHSRIDQQEATEMFLKPLRGGNPAVQVIFDMGTLKVGAKTLGELLVPEDASSKAPAGGDASAGGKRRGGTTPADLVIDVRDGLALSNAEMAARLNMSEQMLCYYLYGNRNAFPDRVMEEVRVLWESVPDETRSLMRDLADRSMQQIVEGWMEDLSIPPAQRNANSLLGQKLDVDRATIWRWRTSKIRPVVADLMLLHRKVSALAARVGAGRR